MFDVILAGGRILNGTSLRSCDVGVKHGRIAAMAEVLDARDAAEVIELDGRLIVPGLVDIHCHIYPGVTALGMDVAEMSSPSGVTTVADAGSCGSETFGLFRQTVAYRTDVRVRCFVNLSRLGMTGISAAGELINPAYSDPAGALRILREHPEVARGVKVRLSKEVTGGPCMDFLLAARRVAAEAHVPLCVHIGNSVETMAEILAELAAGDIVTHYQTPKANGLVDPGRILLPEALRARERGILFDSGHGMTHFDFEVAAALLEQDFPPDIISTDVSRNSFKDLAPGLISVMNKWLALGLGLPEVLAASTAVPAAALRESESTGALATAGVADIAVLTMSEGRFVFTDAGGRKRTGGVRLDPYLTMKDGRIVWDSRHPVVPRRATARLARASPD